MVAGMARREVISDDMLRSGDAANRLEALRQQRGERLPPLSNRMPS